VHISCTNKNYVTSHIITVIILWRTIKLLRIGQKKYNENRRYWTYYYYYYYFDFCWRCTVPNILLYFIIDEQYYWFHCNNIRLCGRIIHSNDDTSNAECNELYSVHKVDVVVYGSNANRWTKTTIVLVCQTRILFLIIIIIIIIIKKQQTNKQNTENKNHTASVNFHF